MENLTESPIFRFKTMLLLLQQQQQQEERTRTLFSSWGLYVSKLWTPMCGGIVCSHKIHNLLVEASFILVSTVSRGGLNQSSLTCLGPKFNTKKHLHGKSSQQLASGSKICDPYAATEYIWALPHHSSLGTWKDWQQGTWAPPGHQVVDSWRLLDACRPTNVAKLSCQHHVEPWQNRLAMQIDSLLPVVGLYCRK